MNARPSDRLAIAVAQLNSTVGDIAGNAEKVRRARVEGAAQGADLVVFPELSVCGYPPRDLVKVPTFVAHSRQALEQLAAELPGIAIIAGFPSLADVDTGKSVMNSAALLRDGRIDFIQSKRLLPTYDVFDEARNFAPALSQGLFSIGQQSVALTICEDAWNDKDYWRTPRYERDPLAGMRMTEEGFAELTRIVRRMADDHCGGKIVSVLEGGYNLKGLASSAAAHCGQPALRTPTQAIGSILSDAASTRMYAPPVAPVASTTSSIVSWARLVRSSVAAPRRVSSWRARNSAVSLRSCSAASLRFSLIRTLA